VIEFEEPGDEYVLEEVKKSNIRTRVKVITLFVVFVLLILFLVKNDFNFNLFQTKIMAFEDECDSKYAFNWNDEEEMYLDKANSVLAQHHDYLKGMIGFDYAIVETEPVGFQETNRPVIKIHFRGVNDTPVKLPERICGYRVSIIYK